MHVCKSYCCKHGTLSGGLKWTSCLLGSQFLAAESKHAVVAFVQVTAAEGFGKTRLFEILDDLEVKTRPIMEEARQRLAKEKGDSALQPHNISHALAGVFEMYCCSST